MSSIYKKGRDGYFYYQTYVRNPDTGKKDKRIFHALGTKDKNEAEALRQKFDKKYKKSVTKTKSKIILSASLGLLTFSLIWFVSFLIDFEFKPERIEEFSSPLADSSSLIKNINDSIEEQTSKEGYTEPVEFDNFKQNFDSETISSLDENPDLKITVPNYYIKRIEPLSDVFDQGKIHVTVEKSVDGKALKALCSKIKEEYSQFSNILICVYANNQTGIALANGFQSDISNELKSENWLALYSYHKVEGEYFDENPGGYLSGY